MPTDKPTTLAISRRVLVVDDNGMNRQMLRDFVEMLGHQCKEASSGAEALELMRTWPPDTVLLDNQMPGMSGLDVLKKLGPDEELRHIPVIMISGMDDLNTVTEALEAGAVDFMGKPFNPAILKARLASSFERKALRDRERELLHSLEASYRDLRRAEAGRDALTHMIVHDLGNPLSVISMNAEMLNMAATMGMPLSTEALKERVDHIASASTSMDTMIRSMLDVSKMESGQLEPSTEPVDLISLLTDIRSRFESVAADSDMSISMHAPTPVTVTTDRILIERMVANLLSNAFKYAEGATSVAISVAADGGNHVEIHVADDGSGIPDDLHEKIFDKFYQVESRESGGVRAGVGLGLAFCRMAADVLGGSIRAENNMPSGTRFVITLPTT
jgi:signal transduction histidine kinase